MHEPPRKVQNSHPLQSDKQQRTCCGVIEQAVSESRERRYKDPKPQPWIVLKLMVFVTSALMAYAGYVYIGRLCVDMIRRKSEAGAGRGTGIALLVIFCILYLWMIIAYIRIVITPPGFARDYVQKTPQPLLAPAPRPISWDTTNQQVEGNGSYVPQAEADYANFSDRGGDAKSITLTHKSKLSTDITGNQTHNINSAEQGVAGQPYEQIPPPMTAHANPPNNENTKFIRYSKGEMMSGATLVPPSSSGLSAETELKSFQNSGEHDINAGVVDSILHPHVVPSTNGVAPGLEGTHQNEGNSFNINGDSNFNPYLQRRPPTHAVLHPVHRYCHRDGIVKPYRAHHCRSCGTCVLKYDHHCPWIGQCVGARNQKFFLNFSQAAATFCSFVFATLLAYTLKVSNETDGDIDPQKVVIIAIAGFFLIFTATLSLSHVRMIWLDQTTVESMQIRGMTDRENEALKKEYGMCAFGAKKRTQKKWDAEWGNPFTEGNIWWRGGMASWRDVMGDSVWGWFLPIGRGKSDGLNYPVNPRFDEEGRWRRRTEWPEALR